MEMEHPLLSIVVPAYNEERRLPETLPRIVDFVRAQEYAAEVIVVDDGSSDGTTSVVEEIAADAPLVRLIKNEHRGKGFARALIPPREGRDWKRARAMTKTAGPAMLGRIG